MLIFVEEEEEKEKEVQSDKGFPDYEHDKTPENFLFVHVLIFIL